MKLPNTVAMEWALRDVLQGRRMIGLGLAVLVPSLFVVLVMLFAGRIPAEERPEVAAVMLTIFIMPPLVAVFALIAAGTVLRAPLEDATILYLLTRPAKRMETGVMRATGVAVVIGVATMLAGLFVTLVLGEVGMAFQAMPGLFFGGFALGALYGLILSLHRFALGAVIVHAVLEATLARIPFPKLTQWTISWHAWGGMGRAADVAQEFGSLPNDGGNILIPLFMGLLSLVLTGLLFHRKAFNLGVAEA